MPLKLITAQLGYSQAKNAVKNKAATPLTAPDRIFKSQKIVQTNRATFRMQAIIQILTRYIPASLSSLLGVPALYKRRRLRTIMRGYRTLRSSNQISRINDIRQAIAEVPLNIPDCTFATLKIGLSTEPPELLVRRYLLMRLGGQSLTRALISTYERQSRPLILPIPKEWRTILAKHEIQVAYFRCALLWQFYVSTLLLNGILKLIKIAIRGIRATGVKSQKPPRYAYFSSLGSGNLPQGLDIKESYDLITWYISWAGKPKGLTEIFHTVRNTPNAHLRGTSIRFRSGPLPDMNKWGTVIKYMIRGSNAATKALIDLFRGRWWRAVILRESVEVEHAIALPAGSLAQEYLFHSLYRPLWSYEAERLGSTISFYFYSTNNETFKAPSGYRPMNVEWKSMNWPRYLVWNEYQANFVRRAVGEQPEVCVVGNIPFQDNGIELPNLPRNSIAIFDVQPMRDSYYRTLGAEIEYYVPSVAIAFLSDILTVLREFDNPLCLKRKRKIGSLVHPKYRHFLKSLESSSGVLEIDPEIAATRLIRNCVAVIAMPFTSVALLGREQGKPSIYYDPTGIIQKDDRAAHGIDVVTGASELREWLLSLSLNLGSPGRD